MHYWPLLDIKHALADADRNLRDIICDIQTLQKDSEGYYPPEADVALSNIGTIRGMLEWVLPQALKDAIAHEQAEYDREEEGYIF